MDIRDGGGMIGLRWGLDFSLLCFDEITTTAARGWSTTLG